MDGTINGKHGRNTKKIDNLSQQTNSQKGSRQEESTRIPPPLASVLELTICQ